MAYGFGSVAFGVKSNGFDYFFLIFYSQVMGVSAYLVSLALMMFVIFQAVFAWAAPFMDGIETFFGWLGEFLGPHISHPLLNSLIVDGVIAGAGGVVVFLSTLK